MTQKWLSSLHLRHSSPNPCHYVDKLHCSSKQMCQGPVVQQVQQGKIDGFGSSCPHPVHNHHPWDRKWEVGICSVYHRQKNTTVPQFGHKWLEFNWSLPKPKYLHCAKWLLEACGKASLQGRRTICIVCKSQIKQYMPCKETSNLKTPHFKREKEMNLKIFDSPTTRTKLCHSHRFHILQGQADQTTISDLFHRDFKVDLDGKVVQ